MTAVLTSTCASKNASTNDKVDSVKLLYSQNVLAVDSSKKGTIKDYSPTNNFAGQPFLLEPTIESLLKEEYQIEKKPQINIYDKNVVDTVVSFKSDSDYFSFYKAKHDTFLTGAVVTSKKIDIKNEISVGMSKEEIKDKLKGLDIYKEGENFYELETIAGYSSVRFEFVNNFLAKVIYSGILD